jgi:hypothetical protein
MKASLAVTVLTPSKTDLIRERNAKHVAALNVRHNKKKTLA